MSSWDGRERRLKPRNGNGNGKEMTIDQRLDRFLKVATIVRWLIVPVIFAAGVLVYEAHTEMDAIAKQTQSTYDMLTQHDRARKERDKIRLQAHHQEGVGFKDSCTKCKLLGDSASITTPQHMDYGGK